MKGKCYFCNTALSHSQLKRCSRCRLATYCSKECQTIAWKCGHKQNCTLPDVFRAEDGSIRKPKKNTQAYTDFEIDRVLTKWMEKWRSAFYQFATVSLDLGSYPPTRVATHCMTMWIRQDKESQNRLRDFYVTKAEVVPVDDHRAKFNTLRGLQPTDDDLTRMRFVVIVENDAGEITRVRCLQWNYLAIELWRKTSPPASHFAGWETLLRNSVATVDPTDIRLMSFQGWDA